MILYHNPRCSKSRQTKELLESKNISFQIKEYLKDPITSDELILLKEKLSMNVIDFTRTKESIFKELGLSENSTEESLISSIIKNPILLERPILLSEASAKIGRPPENILTII